MGRVRDRMERLKRLPGHHGGRDALQEALLTGLRGQQEGEMKLLSHAEVIAAITYDPSTGLFTKPGGLPEAGKPDRKGYMMISVRSQSYRAHRLAWFYMTGKWPDEQIDHINCVPSDNRWENLRLCTRSQNNHNQPIRKNNRSGVKGVHFNPKAGKWHGQVCLNYRIHHVGMFDDLEEAARAVRAKREELHGIFANHG